MYHLEVGSKSYVIFYSLLYIHFKGHTRYVCKMVYAFSTSLFYYFHVKGSKCKEYEKPNAPKDFKKVTSLSNVREPTESIPQFRTLFQNLFWLFEWQKTWAIPNWLFPECKNLWNMTDSLLLPQVALTIFWAWVIVEMFKQQLNRISLPILSNKLF